MSCFDSSAVHGDKHPGHRQCTDGFIPQCCEEHCRDSSSSTRKCRDARVTMVETGSIQRIGMSEPAFEFHDSLNNHRGGRAIDAVDFQAAIAFLVPWLDEQVGLSSIDAIGHRVVYGIHRYGFHGLSFAYLTQELAKLGDAAATRGRVILAHLGNGAVLAAVRDGKSIDTSMGFTPAAGLPMGTRSGDLDPGLVGYLARSEKMTAQQFDQMIHHESGLLGVSELSSDVRDLLALEVSDTRAVEAIALFCYQTKKWIGGFAAAMGGLDTLVFAGGIGENSPAIRARICNELQFLGIEFDENHNAANENLISSSESGVTVRVVRTDEEFMIASQVRDILKRNTNARQIIN